jgi:hypothetical protein
MAVKLSLINAKAMKEAIEEYDQSGREKFLKKYGFSRSSKFYFRYNERLYDVKALIGAAYRHATGEKLANNMFAGGAQSKAVFRRIGAGDACLSIGDLFEDSLGELANLSGEFDRLSNAQSDVRKLGFSKWIQFQSYNNLQTKWLPGVYVIADCASKPNKMKITDQAVVYIGETVEQNLGKRLYQLDCSLKGRPGSSGGTTLKMKGYKPRTLWLSVRSFPLGRGKEKEARSLRSSQIRSLERRLLHEYVLANRAYPAGNSK